MGGPKNEKSRRRFRIAPSHHQERGVNGRNRTAQSAAYATPLGTADDEHETRARAQDAVYHAAAELTGVGEKRA